MLKLKPLIIGILLETGVFLGLMCLLAVAAKSFGNVTAYGFALAIELFSALAVLLGAFAAARIAWERGAVYGGVTALAWAAMRLVYTLVLAGELDFVQVLVKILIVLGLGLTGGILGISKRRQKMI